MRTSAIDRATTAIAADTPNLRQLGLDLVRDVDRAPAPDIAEMPIEKSGA
jgi:hypothetical protein